MQKRSQNPSGTSLKAAEYVAKCKEMRAAQARESFYWFRRLIHPQKLTGWWTDCIEAELQQFYEDLVAGRRPRLAIMAPPQHGKSSAATDFIAWVAGKNPDLKTIFASYSDDLGVRTNLDLKRTIESSNFQLAFGTQINKPGSICNTELIEYVGHAGSFRNTTVRGAVTGMELHLGVIDDPVKGREEAHSPVVREKTWDWFTDDFRPRFAEKSALLIIMTRWHVDDLLGRYIDRSEGIKVRKYAAIAEKDTQYRKAGEALFEELKSLEFLEEQRRLLSEASWQALYQQSPIIRSGGIFPVDKIRVLPSWDGTGITKSVRYWDKAGTESVEAAFTAGVLMHRMTDGRFIISDVVRGQWSALDRERILRQTAERDRKLLGYGAYEIGVEQEPGSGGKESAEHTIRNLAGFRVFADKVTGSKEARADPFAAQVQGGNVYLVAGQWNAAFLNELESFPSGKWKDQVDAAAGAFIRLTSKPAYNLAALAS